MVLGFSLADMMNHIDCFTSVEQALHPGNPSHLVMASNLLYVLLGPVGSYLVENVCIRVHRGYGTIIFSLLVGSLSGFGIKVMLAS